VLGRLAVYFDQAMAVVADAKQQIAACEQRLNAARNIETGAVPPPVGRNNDYARQATAARQFQRDRDIKLAQDELPRAQARLNAAQADADAAKARIPQPEWPTAFEPVSPGIAIAPATTQVAK
jgi:hypothetical protein